MKTLNRRINTLLLFCMMSTGFAYAQSASGGGNGVNSAYSRYGFGQLSDAVIGRQAAMGGLTMGLRDGAQVNVSNPASYSKCDSLTFLFDAGISLQNGNFDNGTTRQNMKNASFDYIVMQFRAFTNIGVSFGFVPFSKIGYSIGSTHDMITDKYGDVTPYSTYEGNGGISLGYVGIGAKVLGGLSVGVNANYMFGDIEHNITNNFTETSVYSSIRAYTASISTLKFDFGLQYELPIGKHNNLILGATYSLGHNINNDAVRSDYTYDNDNNNIVESTEKTISNAFELPKSFGIGFAYQYSTKLTLGVDYSVQKWGSVKYPMTTDAGFVSQVGFLSDRKKVAAGLEWTPNNMSRNYLKRVHYRLGGYYTTPYTRINGTDGAKEFGLSFGFGLPIQNIWNNRSVVNISGQWVHVSPGASQLVKENYLRVCIGLTFDERMFAKWKVQ